jgi:hypothetical protein
MELLRPNPKGKWHLLGPGTDMCPHMIRVCGYRPTSLPGQAVEVLGEYDFGSACAHRVRLPGPAGVFYAAAGLVAAPRWVAEFEQLATSMDWLEVARYDGDARAGHTAMLSAVEAPYGSAPVRDVSLLPKPALTQPRSMRAQRRGRPSSTPRCAAGWSTAGAVGSVTRRGGPKTSARTPSGSSWSPAGPSSPVQTARSRT